MKLKRHKTNKPTYLFFISRANYDKCLYLYLYVREGVRRNQKLLGMLYDIGYNMLRDNKTKGQ